MPEVRRIPGEGGVWLLVGGDLLAFSLFFLVFSYYRHLQPEVFEAARQTLNRRIGLTNTLVLLTSSLFVAIGVRRVLADRAGAGRMFLAAMGCGGLFIVLKAVEYGQKIAHGITPLTNDFYLYYFAFTGIHLAHVVIGSGGLFVMAQVSRREASPTRSLIVECGATFWHLVDLLWIMLFALFYLAGGHG